MKKRSVMILAVCLLFVLAGCGTQYEDTNGSDNFALQTITEQNIINLDLGASGLSFTEEELGDVVSSSGYSAKNFNGVQQLYLTNCLLPSNIEVYIGHMTVTKGNFRLVVVNNDEIIRDIPLDAFNESFYFENITGSFAIHVAGESAAFDFYLDIR